MDETLRLEFDGGSRGNPGPAGIGIVIRAADQTPIVTLGRFIGRATNNVAEYKALITALEKALELGARRITIHGDSELIVKQINGDYRVKHPDLRPLYERAMDLLARFESARITHNRRSHNALADRLANRAMDRKAEITEAEDLAPAMDPDANAPHQPLARGDQYECPGCDCRVEIIQPGETIAGDGFVCVCGRTMNRLTKRND